MNALLNNPLIRTLRRCNDLPTPLGINGTRRKNKGAN